VTGACADCLRRTWLLNALADHVSRAHERFGCSDSLLGLDDRDLLAALAGRRRPPLEAAWERFSPDLARERARAGRLALICRHDHAYPRGLVDLPDPPAVIHVAGDLGSLATSTGEQRPAAAAVVGARRATSYGLEVAQALGRALSAAGVTVVSGMALGVDSAAHEGALAAGGAPTVAVLAGGADRPYPATKQGLYRRLLQRGCAISELPPGTRPRRWCFPARNRIIAALAQATIVVEAAERSGALITARVARDLGREVGAVPGPVTSSRSRGANDLIFDGASPVRDARDILELLFGPGMALAAPAPAAAALEPELRKVLDGVAAGQDTVAALARSPGEVPAAMVALSQLELRGLVRRLPGGRYAAVP
jgi:DNA processing protein